MPSMDATMAWAVQVDVEQLGANLEAYVNLLPSINAVRLCHRYGKTRNQTLFPAAITKLPEELLAYIEDHLVFSQRLQQRHAWSRDFRCFQQICDPREHMTEEALQVYRDAAAQCKIPKSPPPDEELDIEDRVDLHLADDWDIWDQEHIDRKERWEERVGVRSAEKRGYFSTVEDLVKKHFGLDTWISHVRLPDYQVENVWQSFETYPPDTTVAYLNLPGATNVFQRAELKQWEVEDQTFHLESGFGLPVKLPHPLRDGERARFKRMMRMLGLQPFVHDSQRENGLAAASEDLGDGGAAAMSDEPQLTILVRCITRSDEDE